MGEEYEAGKISFPRAAAFGMIGATMSAALASLYATVDAPLALAYQAYKRSAQAKQINAVLKQHANIDFYSLPLRESILVLAAYRHNLEMMKRWVPRLAHFIRKPGVWIALTQLYYQKEPTSELVDQLQKEIEK